MKTVKQRAVPLIMVIMAVALVALTSCTAIDKPASEGSESDSTVGITDNELQEINSVVDSETVKEDETGVAEAVLASYSAYEYVNSHDLVCAVDDIEYSEKNRKKKKIDV